MTTTVYVAARRSVLLATLERAYDEVLRAEERDGSVDVTIDAESALTYDRDPWELRFTNDDMERDEMDGKIILEVER
jgi:hypothetical protein